MTNWQPDLEGRSGPRYAAIADALAAEVAAGRFKPGERLPTHRDLAWRLGVTVGTVSRAYAEAERRGLVSGEVGRGTYVRGPQRPESYFVHDRRDADPAAIDLGVAIPPPGASDGFLGPTLEALAKDPQAAALLGYQPAAGKLEHRMAGTEWLARRGFEVTVIEREAGVAAGGGHVPGRPEAHRAESRSRLEVRMHLDRLGQEVESLIEARLLVIDHALSHQLDRLGARPPAGGGGVRGQGREEQCSGGEINGDCPFSGAVAYGDYPEHDAVGCQDNDGGFPPPASPRVFVHSCLRSPTHLTHTDEPVGCSGDTPSSGSEVLQ